MNYFVENIGESEKTSRSIAGLLNFLILCVATAGLFIISRYNYLLFHGLTEVFIVSVAWAVFLLVWNTRRIIADKSMVLLGIAYLFVGVFHILHLLAYKGMGIFPEAYDADYATQLWIAARYMEGVSFLIFSIRFPLSTFKPFVLAVYSGITGLLLSSIFWWPVFPECYVEGLGLTPFKLASEYIFCLMMAVSALLIYRKRNRLDNVVYRLLISAAVLAILAELAFTYYISVYGISNLVGHFFKIFSFFLIYLALVRRGLEAPYDVLFGNLKLSEERYRFLLDEAPVSIIGFDGTGTISYVNPYHLKTFAGGKRKLEFYFGKKLHDLPDIGNAGIAGTLLQVLDGKSVSLDEVYIPEFTRGGSGYQRIRAVPFLKERKVAGGLLLREDITEIQQQMKKFEAAFQHTPLIMIISDLENGIFLEVNRTFQNVIGYSQDEVVGKNGLELDILAPEDRIRLYSLLKAHRRIENMEIKAKTRAGIPKYFSFWAENIDISGRRCLLSMFLDITERKRLENLTEVRLRLNESSSGMTLPELLRKTVDEAERLTGSEIGFFHFVNGDQETIDLQMWSTRTLETLCDTKPEDRHYPLGNAGIWADCIRFKGSVIHNDYTAEEHRKGLPPGHAPVAREAVVPILRGDKVVAVLGVGNKKEPYTEEDVRVIFDLADVAWDIVTRKKSEHQQVMQARVLDQIRDHVTVTNLLGEIAYANDAALGFLGYERGKVVGKTMDILDENLEKGERRSEIVEQTISIGAWRGDRVFCSKDGVETILDCRTQIIQDANRTPIAVSDISTDITEKRKTEAHLDLSLKRRKKEMEALAGIAVLPSIAKGDMDTLASQLTEITAGVMNVERVGFWLFEGPGKDLVCTDQFLLSNGIHTAGDILRRDEYINEFMEFEKAKHIASDNPMSDSRLTGYRRYFTLNRVTALLDAVIRSGGENIGVLCFEHVNRLHHWEQDEISFACQVADQIAIAFSNRRRHESDSEKRLLASAIDQAVEAILITDNAGVIQYVNPAFQSIAGYTNTEIIGSSLEILKSGGHEKNYYLAILKELISGTVWKGRVEYRRKNGGTFIADGGVSPVLNNQGTLSNFVGVFRDITEDLKLDEKFRQTQKMEAIGALAGGIAHDFNNILFPMTGYAEMLMEDLPENSPLQENVNEILTAAHRAKDLVGQILSFSRKDTQEKKAIRVQPIVKEVLKLIRASLPSTIDILRDIDVDCPPVLADPVQIHQVIMNLATNAFHAMEERGGILSVSLKTQRGGFNEAGMNASTLYVCLKISDTGYGIESSTLNRIFEPYFTTKEMGKGTGLGLSVVHGIIQSHGGEIFVDSLPGKGTTFSVLLPSLKDEMKKTVQTESVQPVGGNEKILLVDDEENICTMSKKMLERLGYFVTVKNSGHEALETFQSAPSRFDLVITDMTMPKMTGDRLSKKLLAIKPDLPIIICTGYSERIDEQSAKEIGVKGFLFKPLVKSDLDAEIRRVIEESPSKPHGEKFQDWQNNRNRLTSG